MNSADKSSMTFIEELASNAPTPGGGGASALCGAVGTALGHMVGSLTVGKKKYADVEDLMNELMAKCESIQKDLLDLIDKDAECFKPLADAYRLPRNTPEEIAYRDEVLEKCSQDACKVPLEIMEKCCMAIDCLVKFAEHGSVMAVSDAGAGMILCKAAMEAASLNVFINTKGMKDRLEADTFNAKAREMLFIYRMKADNVIEMVRRDLNSI